MKPVVALSLVLLAVSMIPTASFAAEAFGIRHGVPCFQCSPDAVEAVHVVRAVAQTSVVVQVNIYDASGILKGNFTIADPGGSTVARQIAFTSTQALSSISLPSGLYSAVLFESTQTVDTFYEEITLGPGGITGILTGRGDLYGYATSGNPTHALTLFPEQVSGIPTGLTNFFVCNIPANDMATFLAIPGPAAGALAIAEAFTVDGQSVMNNYTTSSTFAQSLSQLSPGVTGGSLALFAPFSPVGQKISCVKWVRINVPGLTSTLGHYTY
jgi:hypothetical protein